MPMSARPSATASRSWTCATRGTRNSSTSSPARPTRDPLTCTLMMPCGWRRTCRASGPSKSSRTRRIISALHGPTSCRRARAVSPPGFACSISPDRTSRRRSDSCRSRASDRTGSGTRAAVTRTPPSTLPSSPTMSSRSSTCPTRGSPRSPAAGGSRACGGAGPRRRAGVAGAAMRSIMRWWPARSPTAPGATVASPCSTWPIRLRPGRSPLQNGDPPFGGGTHSPLPLPDRNLLVVADEATSPNCSQGLRYVWLFDIREPSNPVSISTCPTPSETDYCAKGGNFGPHNLHENRPGSFQSSRLIFVTYYNAGVRVFDIENPFQPREVAFYVPPNPERMVDPRPGRPQVIQSADCYVDPNGLMYLTDSNAGLNILEFEGP